MKVYADVLFAVNFAMDFLIVCVSEKLIDGKIRKKRTAIVSALWSLFTVWLTFLNLKYILTVSIHFFIMLFMIYVLFRPKSVKELAKDIFLFLISSFAVGGVFCAVFFMTGFYEFVLSGGRLIINAFPLKLFIFCFSVSAVMFKVFEGVINTNIRNRNNFCSINIKENGQEVNLTALIDTGMDLYSEEKGRDVIVAEFLDIYKFFPKEIRSLIFNNEIKKAKDLVINGGYKNLSIVNYKSLGNEEGYIIGIDLDSVNASMNGKSTCFKNIILCGYNGILGGRKGFNSIIGSDLIKQWEMK